MQWTAEEHESLLHFLSNVTSKDPIVQRDNLSYLYQLTQWNSAPYAILDVLCHNNYTNTIRQAAVLILKQIFHMNPNFVEKLDIKMVESSLLNALSDLIPTVRVGASLVIASIIRGEGISRKWPGLLYTLHQNSYDLLIQFQQEKNLNEFSSIILKLNGLATCIRILCEECSETLHQFIITNKDNTCIYLSEILTYIIQSSSILIQNNISCNQTFILVIEAITSCFKEEVFLVGEISDNISEIFSEISSDNAVTLTENYNFLTHAESIHESCCLFIIQLSNLLMDFNILKIILEYINTTLQWNKFGSISTIKVSEIILPFVLHYISNTNEEIIIICLDFINNLSQYSEDGVKVISNLASNVMRGLFQCSVLSSFLLDNPSLERTINIPDDITNIRSHIINQRTILTECDNFNDDENNNINNNEDIIDDSETATSVRQALNWTLDIMSCTCRKDIISHLIPILVSILTPNPNNCSESLQLIEAALFIFVEIVEELFEDLDSEFIIHVAQSCWAILSSVSSYSSSYSSFSFSSPYYLRYQAVRCIARIASGCIANSEYSIIIIEAISASSVLQLLVNVVVNDFNKQVQVEAIHSITAVMMASLADARRSGEVENMNFSLIYKQLLDNFSLMQLGARTMMYRSISQTFPIALDIPPLIDNITLLQVIKVLGNHGQQLTLGFQLETNNNNNASAVEIVSLMNTLVDVISSSKNVIIMEVISPLLGLSNILLNSCTNEKFSSPMDLYSNDIITLVFDMLDGCCDSVLSEEELLRHTEISIHHKEVLRELIFDFNNNNNNNNNNNIVNICLKIMEIQPEEVELRRSCLAFLTSIVRFCNDSKLLWRIYRICINESFKIPIVKKSISNAFLCMAQIFFYLKFQESSESLSIFINSISEDELNNLSNILQNSLSCTEFIDCMHIKNNAFSCSLALSVIYPIPFLKYDKEGIPYCSLIENAVIFLSQMENDIGDQYRALIILAFLVSQYYQIKKHYETQPPLPSIVEICKFVMNAFITSAPKELIEEVQKQWMPWINLISS